MFRYLNLLLLITILSLSACTSVPVEEATPAGEATQPAQPAASPEATSPEATPTSLPAASPEAEADLPPEAVLIAQQQLAQELGVAVEQVTLAGLSQQEWTDSCLGLGQANESCLVGPIPGWQAFFEVNGQTYEVRTDETGATVRIAQGQTGGAAPPPGAENELAGTAWTLTSFGAPGAETPVIEGSTITLEFGADGQAGGSSGCNSYGGPYQVEDGSLSLGQMQSTLMACADNAVMQQEQQYFQALESSGVYEFRGDQLVISYDNGQGVLNFARG